TGGPLGPPPLSCHDQCRQTDDVAEPELAPSLPCRLLGGLGYRLGPLQDFLLHVCHTAVLPAPVRGHTGRMMGGMRYRDYAATTPVLDEVVEVMLPYLRRTFGNPSSVY